MKKFISVFLSMIMVFTMIPTGVFASTISEMYYGSGPIRSMTLRQDGVVIGGRSSGNEIEVWSSTNKGTSWTRIGTVASNSNINYGDVMFLAVPQTDIIYCAFREKNANNQYSVVVCRSDNGGYDWVYDSTVISGCTQFVGAPWLFIAQNGDMQCYYDSEPLATQNGVSGAQWIAMQGREGLSGTWDKYGVVAASRDADATKFVRDGMASVVDLGNNRIMVVTEGIEDSKSGGAYSNVVRAIQSFDGGYTWNYAGRQIVYQSKIDSASGRRYNAYCPMAIRVGNGPVGVVFCTDEDFGGTPDASSEDVTKRRTHIKYIRTLDNFETWGDITSVWTDGSSAYAPGMVETASNEVLISIDHFSGNQRFYFMDVLAKGGTDVHNPNISGKTFFFLGSSVTYGYAAGGVSFVDYISQRNDCTCVKEAVSGTTLVDNGSTSYVSRMLNNLDSTAKCDHFICQLSTNDATQNLPLGSVSSSYNSSDFDKSTIIGAMEYIISYAKNTWNCPVTFYTNTYYNNSNYQAMVDALYKLQEKWSIGIIDLWNNESMRNVSASDYARYMADNIHPTAAGYEEWWTPVFEEYLQNFDYAEYTQSSEPAVIPGTGSVLYSNDFANSNGLAYYPGLIASTPVYSNNTLTISGGNSNKIVVSDENFTDFVVEADIRVMEDSSKDSNQGGIIFRATNPYSEVSDGYDGYYFGIDALKNEVILGKVHQNQWIQIATKRMTVEYNKYYHVSVAVSGNEIKGYVNYNGENYAKIVAVDDDFTSGTVGFRHWLAGANFRNLKVSEYTPEVPDETYTNSVLNACADPDVLYYNGVYYMYATNTENANLGFKVYSSVDLVNWTDRGLALSKNDVYGESNFWAPDLIEKDGTFYMYYVADEHLSVATSDSPLGPFKQTEEEKKPMHEGKEIDAHVFRDDDGQYYIYFVRFYGQNGVTDGNYIYGAKLNPDMRTMDESTITCLISPEETWETNKAKVVEGPFMLKKDGIYYLTYSGSHFESDYYGSGYATSTSPLGTYSKYENNPIMQSNTLVHGAGHHGIVASPDGSEMFIVYHCHSSLTTTEPRRLCIDRIHFTEDDYGKTVLEVYGPTITPQAMPSAQREQPTEPPTEAETSAEQGSEPIEVFGEIVTNPSDNVIGVVWGQNEEQLKLGQKYNVYVDGILKLEGVGCAYYDIPEISEGVHTVKITAVLGKKETAGVVVNINVSGKELTQETTTEKATIPETTTEEETTTVTTINGGIEINGYQVSAITEGMRTVYSVDSVINGKDVVSSGVVYSLADYADENALYVGSNSYYVRSYESTAKGKFAESISKSDIATSYAMTMKFATKEIVELQANWRIRAYAKLSDGTYVYTEPVTYTIYDIADTLYKNSMMSNEAFHDYLYTDILLKGNKDYLKQEYKGNSVIANAE